MQQYKHEVENVEELRHLGTFGMKLPYQVGTHEDNSFATEYTKLDPQVLTIASSAMACQRRSHVFLRECHAAVVKSMSADITELRRVIDIDS